VTQSENPNINIINNTIAMASAVGENPKPFSISFGAKAKPPAAKVNPKKRNYATLTADDSEEEGHKNGKEQFVSSFDQSAGGAVSVKKADEKGPLVIAAQKNLNWRDEARRKKGKNLLPEEEQAKREGQDVAKSQVEEVEENPVYGLMVTKKDVNDDTQMVDANVDIRAEETKPKTADEEALDALLGNKKSTLVIERTEEPDTRFTARANDTNSYRSDVADRPESATLADYDAVPIEEFGAALLRGMGWKEGDPIGRRKGAVVKPRVVEKRPALLGIGAKEVPEGMEEFGAWGKGSKKSSRIDRNYNPLVLKNKITGEILTEDQLKARDEQNKLVSEDYDRRDKDSDGKKSRRHRDRDDEWYESRRSSKRERSQSKDRSYKDDRRHRDRSRDKRDKDDRRERDKDRRETDDRRDRDRKPGKDRDYDRKYRERDYEYREKDKRRDEHKRR
jgi:hypothetical protein